VVAAYRECGVPIARVYGCLECPTALSQGFEIESDSAGADVDGTAVGRPVPDCRARLVDGGGEPLEGEADGRLQLSGPMLADGYVTARGADVENWDEPAELERDEHDESDERSDRGRFIDGWFDTADRFRRDGDGNYVRR